MRAGRVEPLFHVEQPQTNKMFHVEHIAFLDWLAVRSRMDMPHG